MRRLRGAPVRTAGLMLCLGLLACQAGPLSGPAPDPAQVAVGSAEVPSDLRQCPGSGGIDGYLAELKPKNQAAYQAMEDGWLQLKKEGATGGAITAYTTGVVACTARLGTSPGRSLVNLVAAFPEDRAAAAAYQHGVLGFPTPASDEETSGVSQGVATGLSENAWVAQRSVGNRNLYVAWWQDRALTSFLVTADLDATESRRAAQAVEARIR
jgi:hypothetical protein